MKDKYIFRDCTMKLLDDLFGLRRTFSSQVLDDWLIKEVPLTEQEQEMLRVFQKLLILNRDSWNEYELAMNFIGPILALANFTELYRFNLFSQRSIGAKISTVDGREVELSGEPDGIIATGYYEPEIPMFAFSEYKRLLEPKGDPAGQTLAPMLVGQTFDTSPKPFYGCYVIGHDWYFLVLEGKHYTISQNYSASTASVFDIFRILKALKQIIETLVPEAR